MVRFALNAIRDQDYDNWHLFVIDDGSEPHKKVEPVVSEILGNYLEKITFLNVGNTIEEKVNQGGSIFGKYMNEAVSLATDCDLIVWNCDDDSLYPDYLHKLSDYYIDNPEIKYSYGHGVVYNPLLEKPDPSFTSRPYPHSPTHPINCNCVVDACQVSFRRSAWLEHGILCPAPQTANIDSAVYQQCFNTMGPAPFNGLHTQYKGFYEDQLGRRTSPYETIDTTLFD